MAHFLTPFRHLFQNPASMRASLTVLLNTAPGGFPGGPVVKNLPCNAGDTSLIPGPGRCHMHGVPKPVTATTEPVPWSP